MAISEHVPANHVIHQDADDRVNQIVGPSGRTNTVFEAKTLVTRATILAKIRASESHD